MEVSGRNLIIVADTTFTTVKTYRKNITNVSFRQFFPKYLQNTSLMKWVLSMDTSLGKFPTINPVFLFAQFSHSCRWTNLFAANLTWLPHSFKLSWLVLKADILHMIWLMVFFFSMASYYIYRTKMIFALIIQVVRQGKGQTSSTKTRLNSSYFSYLRIYLYIVTHLS